jgi:hypothetical protein
MDEKKLTRDEWGAFFGELNRISDDAERNALIDATVGPSVGYVGEERATYVEIAISNYR